MPSQEGTIRRFKSEAGSEHPAPSENLTIVEKGLEETLKFSQLTWEVAQ